MSHNHGAVQTVSRTSKDEIAHYASKNSLDAKLFSLGANMGQSIYTRKFVCLVLTSDCSDDLNWFVFIIQVLGQIQMSQDINEKVSRDDVLRMAVDVVAAYVSNNQISTSQIGEVIHSVFNSLNTLEEPLTEAPAEPQKPATSIRKSVTPEYIICLEDGKKLKMLKRHLRTTYNMTPQEYRSKWNLAPDYPMVASNYARQRSDFAKKIGLGRKAREKGRSGRSRG